MARRLQNSAVEPQIELQPPGASRPAELAAPGRVDVHEVDGLQLGTEPNRGTRLIQDLGPASFHHVVFADLRLDAPAFDLQYRLFGAETEPALLQLQRRVVQLERVRGVEMEPAARMGAAGEAVLQEPELT